MTITKYKAALVHSEPAWFDLEASVQKTIDFINEAGAAGCKLLAFPEVWIPGYPLWAWKLAYQQMLPLHKKYREHALPVDSDEMRRIRRATRDNSIYVSLGFSEIDQASLYISQVLISPSGAVLNHRRKIKPAHLEKLIFADGTGDSFLGVSATADIGSVGQLNCWENMNPFLKALGAAAGEQVHVAASGIMIAETTLKPGGLESRLNTADTGAEVIARAYAIETAAWTLAPFQRVSGEGLRMNAPPGVEPETDASVYNGFSTIYGPDGTLVARADKEFDGLLFVDIDLAASHITKSLADFGGHFMRPDLVRLLVDSRRKELVSAVAGADGVATYSTRERLGLDRPLDSAGEDDETA